MSNFKIVADSACDLEENYCKENNIKIVPFSISFDEINYMKEHIDITPKQIFDKLTTDDTVAKTSLPSINDYVEIFESILSEGSDVLCVTISNKLSGSVQSALNAAQIVMEDYPDREVVVVDSLHATATEGMLVSIAVDMKNKNYSLTEVKNELLLARENANVIFTVDDLSYLVAGGRLSKTAGMVGSVLSVKPIITLEEGLLEAKAKVRGRKKAIDTILSNTYEKAKNSENTYISVVSTKQDEEQQNLYNTLVEKYPSAKVSKTQLGATIGAHVGPTALGIAFMNR